MNHPLTAILAALLAAPAAASADDLPRKAPITKYTGLWTNSPFTSRPAPVEAAPEVNPLEDYALAGVSPVDGGFRVTLLERSNPDERIIIDTRRPSSNPDHNFKVLEVERSPGRPLATTVRLQSGNVTGTVAFDEALLTLKAPPPPPQPEQRGRGGQQLPPGVAPGQDGAQAEGRRQPRPRVVAPQQQGNQQQGGRPDPRTQQRGGGADPRAQNARERVDRRGGRR